MVNPTTTTTTTKTHTMTNNELTGRRKVNFGAGPAALPLPVLNQLRDDLISFGSSGTGILELSHRTKDFEEGVLAVANANLKQLLFGAQESNSEEWRVLWMSGGGTGQFACVPLNLINEAEDCKELAVYWVTGTWSLKAYEEAVKLLGVERVVLVDLRTCLNRELEDGRVFIERGLLPLSEWKSALINALTAGSGKVIKYCYYCDNETVDGLELPSSTFIQEQVGSMIEELKGALWISDMSSNFLSRPVDTGKLDLIFAGVQKNLGPAGVTVVLFKQSSILPILRNRHIPTVMDYNITAKNNSLYNTPPVFAIHACNLVLSELIGKFGDLRRVDEFSRKKSDALYACIDENVNWYCLVQREYRSRMNCVFKGGEEVFEETLLGEAKVAGLMQLKGHRSVGGLRASLYNAVSWEDTCALLHLLQHK